jgi:2-methylcitrate dehydratase PrpD
MLVQHIAERSVALDPHSFDPMARKWAKDAIADMIGCALLGARTATTDIALATSPNAGDCLVLGRKARVGRLEAAYVNATSGHALDYDDTSKSLSGHPTVIIIPALLALAEQRDATGAELLDAYIVGVETATRIARGVNFHHYEKGWHPTATLGIFGAAAACGRLLALPADRLAHALATAASFASGVKANFGTQTKPLHAGFAARNGLFAALLAAGGVPASPEAFEHPQGFLEVFNGTGHFNADRMLEAWGQPLDLLAPGISIKKYPCVYSVHGAIDAAIELRRRESLTADSIAAVTVRMHRRRLLPHVRNPATSALNAKFSMPYAVARGLVNGAVTLSHFEDDALYDPQVTRVMELIGVDEHSDDANDYGAEIVVVLSDGTRLTASVSSPLGRGPEAPLPDGMLRAKYTDCAGRALTAAGIEASFDMLMRLEDLDSVRELTALIQESSCV